MSQRKELKEAFESAFHQKDSFDNFLNMNVDEFVEKMFYGNKEIYKPIGRLKQYHRFLNKVIFEFIDFDASVTHSFTKGRSTQTAVYAHKDSRFFFTADIFNYFYTISKISVREILHNNTGNSPILDVHDYIDRIIELVTHDNRLPIGFSTSPAISNSYLLEFDGAINDYCLKRDIIYTRYADDLIFSSNSKKAFINIEHAVEKLLIENTRDKLRLNLSKSKINHIGNRVKILGLIITPGGQVTVDVKLKNKIETLLYAYKKNKSFYEDYLEANFGGDEKKVFGYMHYIRSTDRKYADKLISKYGNYTVNYFLKDR